MSKELTPLSRWKCQFPFVIANYTRKFYITLYYPARVRVKTLKGENSFSESEIPLKTDTKEVLSIQVVASPSFVQLSRQASLVVGYIYIWRKRVLVGKHRSTLILKLWFCLTSVHK